MILLFLLASVWASVSLGADIIVTVNPEHEGQAFGAEMACLGDVNADGHDDFLVIDASQSGPGYRGRAYVYFGGPGVDDTADLVLQQDDTGSLSQALAGPFDFNGDGYGDIAVSSPNYDVAGMENAGAVFIYFGGPQLDAIADDIVPGWWTRYYFGSALARAGRWNADEYDDLAVTIKTIYGWGPPHTVYVYFGGPTPADTSGWSRANPGYDEGFADHVEFAGDTNGDGAGDLVHGLPWRPGWYSDGYGGGAWVEGVGALMVNHGGDLMWHAGYVYQPADIGQAYLGYDVDGDFDFNGDGLTEVVGAAPDIRATRVVLGDTDTNDGTALSFVPGQDVAGLGDINGDGFDDLAIADLTSAVWIFLGGSPPDTIPDLVLEPEPGEEWESVEVERAGDINHDGFADIMIHFRDLLSWPDHLDRVRIYAGSDQLTHAVDLDGQPPAISFAGASPNPFNPRTDLAFSLRSAGRTQVRLFDARGRLVRSLLDDELPAGHQTVTWDGTDDAGHSLPSGVYLVQIVERGLAASGEVALVR